MRKRKFQGVVGGSVKRTRCGKIQHKKTVPVPDPAGQEEISMLPEYIKKMLRHEKPSSASAQLKLFGNPYDPKY